MALQRPRRTRTRNIVIRLSEAEREMLDRVTGKLGLASISDAFRFLLKREDAQGSEKIVPLGSAEEAKANPEAFLRKLAGVILEAAQAETKKNQKVRRVEPLEPKKKKRPRR